MAIRIAIALMVLCLAPMTVFGETGPKISFDNEVHDYGKVLYGNSVSHEFELANQGDQTLIIEKLRSTCGCTNAVEGNREIPPGGKSKIVATFNTENQRAGKTTKSVYVHTNDPARPVIKLTLSADVVREMTVDQMMLIHKSASFVPTVVFPVKIASSHNRPVAINGLKLKGAGVTAKMEPQKVTVASGSDAAISIVLELTQEKDRYIYAGDISLETDHPREKTVALRYFAQMGERPN
jgi:hypothetical protein